MGTFTFLFSIFYGFLWCFLPLFFPCFSFWINAGDIYFMINCWYFRISYSLIWLMLFMFYLCICSIYSYLSAWPNNLSTNLWWPVWLCIYYYGETTWGFTSILTALGKELSRGFCPPLAYLILWLNRDFFLVD